MLAIRAQVARARILLAAAAVVAGALLLACGGGADGGGLPVEEYFHRLVALDEETELASDAIQEQFEAELAQAANEQEGLELYRLSVGAQIANFEGFVDQLEALDPPAKIRDEHKDGLADLRNYIAIFQDIQEEMLGVGSLTELQELLRRDDFTQADQRATAFCDELVALAGEDDIQINLNCSGE